MAPYGWLIMSSVAHVLQLSSVSDLMWTEQCLAFASICDGFVTR